MKICVVCIYIAERSGVRLVRWMFGDRMWIDSDFEYEKKMDYCIYRYIFEMDWIQDKNIYKIMTITKRAWIYETRLKK